LTPTGACRQDAARKRILETAVERARVCGWQAGWQGATTRMAAPCKEAQRSQAACQPHTRARSGLTRSVTVIEGANLSTRAVSRGLTSGQLPFPG